MFAFWRSKADSETVEPQSAVAEPAAPLESSAPEPEQETVVVVEELVVAEPEAPPAAEPEPPKMPHKVLGS